MPVKRNRRRTVAQNHEQIRYKRKKSPCQHADSRSGKIMRSSTSYPCLPEVVVKPGIKELTLVLCKTKREYNFPCSLLSDGVQNSIRYLKLNWCAFRPTAELGPLRSLTSLHLRFVSITGEELQCLLSNSPALEELHLSNCMEIICLKIPCTLQKFRYLYVMGWCSLKVLENKAPNLSSFFLRGSVKLSLGDTLQMKKLDVVHSLHYARSVLPSVMPNLESLQITSGCEVVNTTMLPTKFFLHLKNLTIHLISGLAFSPTYDYFSLVSFFDASPSLETLILNVRQQDMKHESVLAKSSDLREIPENRHSCLKSVKISGFSSAKSLVELTCYIIKNMVSLESLTLDTICVDRSISCYLKTFRMCYPIGEGALMEAPRALSAIRTYIEAIVPSTFKLTVLKPCSRCHVKGIPRCISNT
uniref:At1g61320/AtMIF1 LRR domain-containing protein n=1 Tax=Leersia perrieri TaxID=77586 RepID=A0A0D9WK21_9ORYZ